MKAGDDYDDLPELDGEAPHSTVGLISTRSTSRVRQFTLTKLAHDGEATSSYASDGTPVVIGTHSSASWRLRDGAVSRFHCELSVTEDGRVQIRDLGSRNGTWVDGVRVELAWLSGPATLQVGSSRLRFEQGGSVAMAISDGTKFGDVIGAGTKMRRVLVLLEAAARTDATVLLQGETGTGKDVAAESLHSESARKHKPFVIADCGSMSPSLIQSELFGHVKGAFTGADRDRIGAFEAADGGTLFLDEVGELPVELQPHLLRVLETREVQRLGDHRRRKVDVRIIAATHRDLKSAVNAKEFRSDLYYRLAVIVIELPPLRERLDDLPALTECLLDNMAAPPETRRELLSASFQTELRRHTWPGNVRELRNCLEASMARRTMAVPSATVAPKLSNPVDTGRSLREVRDELVSTIERDYLKELYVELDGSIAKMARRAGISRMQMYRLLGKHGVR